MPELKLKITVKIHLMIFGYALMSSKIEGSKRKFEWLKIDNQQTVVEE